MTPPPRAVRTGGRGPDVLFVHGTAADSSTWTVLTRLLEDRIRATVYDRRGTLRWPVPSDAPMPEVPDHADDAADIIRRIGRPVHVCGISFGAVVTLHLMTQAPELVRSAVLFEPAVPLDTVPTERRFLSDFEDLIARGTVALAAERFYRRSLGDAVWNRLPRAAKEDGRRRWHHIRCDLSAIANYRVLPATLENVTVPVLLLKGGRSRPEFEPRLRALAAALPCSSRQVIAAAEHQPRGAAWVEFASALTAFISLPERAERAHIR